MIIGQDTLINEVRNIFKIFYSTNGVIKPHFILTGASGSGKSFTISTLCKEQNIKMLEINAAQLTKEGTSGNSLSKALTPLMNYVDQHVVCFVDEFDKLFISNNSNSSIANEVTVGVQNEFLRMLESDMTSVYGDYGKYINIDISKVLFVFAGAFNNEEDIDINKLKNFGVKNEFLGRVGLIYNTNKLSLSDLYTILDNAELLKNYLKLYPEVKKEEVVSVIKKVLKKNYKDNTLGARIINTLIHQYFIKNGKVGFDKNKDINFNNTLKFNI